EVDDWLVVCDVDDVHCLHIGRVAGGGLDHEVLERCAVRREGVEDAPLAEAVHGGGAQADSGADLPDAGGLFVDVDPGAEQAQRFGGRRAAVAGSDDGDLQVLEVRELHGGSLYFWRVRKAAGLWTKIVSMAASSRPAARRSGMRSSKM